jgi:hypothetical protein
LRQQKGVRLSSPFPPLAVSWGKCCMAIFWLFFALFAHQLHKELTASPANISASSTHTQLQLL